MKHTIALYPAADVLCCAPCTVHARVHHLTVAPRKKSLTLSILCQMCFTSNFSLKAAEPSQAFERRDRTVKKEIDLGNCYISSPTPLSSFPRMSYKMKAKVAPRLQHALIVTVINRTVPATGGFVVASAPTF